MAIYHLHAAKGRRESPQGKRESRSASASYAYITRQGSYKSQPGILAATGSGHMPAWASADPGAYWKAADAHERANARLFRSYEFALPRELTEDQRLSLVRTFSEGLTSTPDGKLPYSFSIHTDAENHNPHCHLIISERVNDNIERNAEQWFKRANKQNPEQGGAVKTQFLDKKKALINIRKMWEKYCNDALIRAGEESRVSCGRLVGTYPVPHIGPTVKAMDKKGKKTRKMADYAARKEEREDMDRTRAAVQRQIEAMDCELYQIGIFDPDKGMMMREWDYEMLLKSIDYLKRMNALGNEIYIRPAASTDAALILLDDLPASTALTLQADGLAPACITETSPGNFQAWIRISETPVNSAIRGTIARRLADELGADRASAEKRHFGRLAGFTNRKPKRTLPNGHHPFVLCHRSDGVVAARGADLIREAEATLSEKRAASEKRRVSEEPRVAQAPRSNTHAAPPRPRVRLDADTAFRDHWRAWEAQGGTDKSAGDFAVACRMVWEGYGSYEIERAMAANSPDIETRKPRGYVGAYCIATVEKAREAVKPPLSEREDVSEEETRGPRPGY